MCRIWENRVLGIGNSNYKGPKSGLYLEGLRNGEEATLVNIKRVGGGHREDGGAFRH